MSVTPDFPSPETPTWALFDHILRRYHDTHRSELPKLLALSRKVETVHADDPNAPHGLTEALQALVVDLEAHMRREESVVIAALDHTESRKTPAPFTALRRDHHTNEAMMNKIAAITHGFKLPVYACGSWRQLYAGLSKLVDDLEEHMFLEDTFLFPRFEANA
ncbi:MAG: hemerythrin domain-containing protein [Pseudomonadota bacterium]